MSGTERGSISLGVRKNGEEKRYVPCARCKRKQRQPDQLKEGERLEVKSAQLRTWENGQAALTIVDEDYELHSISGHEEALRMLLQDVELPNFIWIHGSGGRSYYAEGTEYKGFYRGGPTLSVLEQYRKKDNAA